MPIMKQKERSHLGEKLDFPVQVFACNCRGSIYSHHVCDSYRGRLTRDCHVRAPGTYGSVTVEPLLPWNDIPNTDSSWLNSQRENSEHKAMLVCNVEEGSRLKTAFVLIHECTVDHLNAKDVDGCWVTDISRHTQASSVRKGNPGWTKVTLALMSNLANQWDCTGVTNQGVWGVTY